jgi:hypothetical protein
VSFLPQQALAKLAQDEVPVIFAGFVHTRKTKDLPFVGTPPGAQSAQPMASRTGASPISASVTPAVLAGGACRGAAHSASEPGAAVDVFAVRPSRDPAYDAEYIVGSLTASVPAIQPPQ